MIAVSNYTIIAIKSTRTYDDLVDCIEVIATYAAWQLDRSRPQQWKQYLTAR